MYESKSLNVATNFEDMEMSVLLKQFFNNHRTRPSVQIQLISKQNEREQKQKRKLLLNPFLFVETMKTLPFIIL